MLLTGKFLCDGGAPRVLPAGWARRTAQWFGVVLAHAAVIGLVLQMSPQARQTLGEIIQASLISPQPHPVAKPPEPPKPPKALPPPRPSPVLAATTRTDAPPASFIVEEPPAEPVSPAPSAPAPVVAQLPLVPPVFNADYLENPPPAYPPMSRRLGEKGRVLLRVFVSTDGRAEHIEINASSGFARLDLAAREAVAAWRFVPARRGDERVAAWVLVPISFVM